MHHVKSTWNISKKVSKTISGKAAMVQKLALQIRDEGKEVQGWLQETPAKIPKLISDNNVFNGFQSAMLTCGTENEVKKARYLGDILCWRIKQLTTN